jgi:hypothetical protein
MKFMTEGGNYPFKIKHVFLKCPVVEEEGRKEHSNILEVLCPPSKRGFLATVRTLEAITI